MKTIRVSDLSGVELDYWVAVCLWETKRPQVYAPYYQTIVGGKRSVNFAGGKFSPSTNWNDCGPLIEEARLEIYIHEDEERPGPWRCVERESRMFEPVFGYGSNPREAICRAFIASKKGEEFNAED